MASITKLRASNMTIGVLSEHSGDGRGRSTDLSNVAFGSRLCENYFLATETKYLFMKLAFAATMNRPRYLLDSIIAQKDTASAFSHSLGQKRKSSVDLGMSALGV